MTKENKTTTNTKEDTLLKAFEESLSILKNGLNYTRNKVAIQSESLNYALRILKDFGNITPLKKLLIGTNLYKTYESYLEYIGIFLKYDAKKDFLKVIKEDGGLFLTTDYPSFKNFKENIQEKQKPVVDYNKRLSTLFKGLPLKQVQDIVQGYFTSLNK